MWGDLVRAVAVKRGLASSSKKGSPQVGPKKKLPPKFLDKKTQSSSSESSSDDNNNDFDDANGTFTQIRVFVDLPGELPASDIPGRRKAQPATERVLSAMLKPRVGESRFVQVLQFFLKKGITRSMQVYVALLACVF